MTEYLNFIGGEWVPSESGRTFENRNPANWEEVVGTHPASTAQDVARAVEAAKGAFPGWRDTPAPVRAEVLKRATDILVERKEEQAQLMAREMGKVLTEARGDVQEAIDTGYYAYGEGRRLFSRKTVSELPDKLAYTQWRPIGVCAMITPWNFPMAIPSWKLFPALLLGNTAVIKPASDTPACTCEFAKILQQAGLPNGVLNVVTGAGGEVGEAILEHPDVRAVSFTGSSEVGAHVAERAGANHKQVSLEMGGKNPQLVMPSADLELAVDGVLWGAFGTQGQRCTATSRLLLHSDIYGDFISGLLSRMERLKLGDPLDESVQIGPVINEKQRASIHRYVEKGQKEGASLTTGGKQVSDGEYSKGWFYAPTVFEGVKPDMVIAQEEIFGPVLSVIRISSFDEAVEVANGVKYGLSSSIYTSNLSEAMRAVELLDAGITYVNAPTIGAECHLPFGGVKQTGNGHREGGWTAYEIFAELKTVYIDYSGKLQRAQIDT